VLTVEACDDDGACTTRTFDVEVVVDAEPPADQPPPPDDPQVPDDGGDGPDPAVTPPPSDGDDGAPVDEPAVPDDDPIAPEEELEQPIDESTEPESEPVAPEEGSGQPEADGSLVGQPTEVLGVVEDRYEAEGGADALPATGVPALTTSLAGLLTLALGALLLLRGPGRRRSTKRRPPSVGRWLSGG
jgi:hypothetical protein